MKFDLYKTKMLFNGIEYIEDTVELETLDDLIVFIQDAESKGKYIAVTFNTETYTETYNGTMIESNTFIEHIHAITSLELTKVNKV